MKISTRFEVFKRDDFTCLYCGRKPPIVVLEVDHILPKTKGGSDEETNLTTSCWDCNRGKRDTLLTDKKTKIKIEENISRIKEQEVQLKEYSKYLATQQKRKTKEVNEIAEVWANLYNQKSSLTARGHSLFFSLLERFTKEEIERALNISVKIENPEQRFKYMCGVLNNWRPTPERELKNYWKSKPHGTGYLPFYVLKSWTQKYSSEEIKKAMDEADGYWAKLRELLG